MHVYVLVCSQVFVRMYLRCGISFLVFKIWPLVLQNLALKINSRGTLRENVLKKKEQQVKCEEVLHRMHLYVED